MKVTEQTSVTSFVGYSRPSVDKGQFCMSQIGSCSQKRQMAEKTLKQYSNIVHYMGGRNEVG